MSISVKDLHRDPANPRDPVAFEIVGPPRPTVIYHNLSIEEAEALVKRAKRKRFYLHVTTRAPFKEQARPLIPEYEDIRACVELSRASLLSLFSSSFRGGRRERVNICVGISDYGLFFGD